MAAAVRAGTGTAAGIGTGADATAGRGNGPGDGFDELEASAAASAGGLMIAGAVLRSASTVGTKVVEKPCVFVLSCKINRQWLAISIDTIATQAAHKGNDVARTIRADGECELSRSRCVRGRTEGSVAT